MTAAVIILSIMLAFMLTLYVMQRIEISSITKQLSDLKAKDTNSVVSSVNGTADMLIKEINHLLKEIRKTKVEYHQKNHALEQMMTNISHDLRTPLTSAMGYIRIIQSSDLDEAEKKRELDIIEKRLIRLEELINSFFEFSKIISNGKEPEKSEINLISVIEESIAHYYDDYCARSREIIFETVRHKLIINSNKNMLLRIFDNLIGNALKHGSGSLTVSVETAEAVRIMFVNRMNDANIDIDRIFDEFYTTDISRTRGNTGLGLAIVKQFTEMLSGTISAQSTNTLFTLTITFPIK